MSPLRLILASLLYHWRMNLAVACGVAAATAVLTGALLVGDSMHGSLEHLTLDRLGRIDEVLVAPRFFRQELVKELAAEPEFQQQLSVAVPAIILRASLDSANVKPARRANRVNLIGCDERFWQLGTGRPNTLPEKDKRQIVLNRPLAQRLGVKAGDWVILRTPQFGTIPAETPLGRTDETVGSHRMKVVDVVAAQGLGRFSMRPSQHLPRNAYVSLDWLAASLQRTGRCNAILVAGKRSEVRPRLEDYGLRLERSPLGYFNITSPRMLLDPGAESELLDSLSGLDVQPVLTYLAIAIAVDRDAEAEATGREIPYSTIAALDLSDRPPLGPFRTPQGTRIGPIGNGEIVLNSWAARELGATPGDTIRVSYFEPESTHGDPAEQSAVFKLAAVAQLAGPADDRDFTPRVTGITDEGSMTGWKPPFPFHRKRILDADERYWDDHGPTPKAFVSLATGRRLWGSRLGQTTSLRIRPAEGITAESLQNKLALDPARLGFVFQPVKQQGLAASAGTTPFNVLFLSFSFFIIAAAVMLVALLFRLGIDRRAGELGILLALGLRRGRLAWLLLAEGTITAAVGSSIGVAAGVAYAALMLLGLRTLWLNAVVTPFLRLYITPTSLAAGFASGVAVSMLAILWAVRRCARVPPRRLLAGRTAEQSRQLAGRPRWAGKIALGLLVAALAAGLAATWLGEQMQAAAFFGAGALVLVAGLTWIRSRLKAGATGAAVAVGRGNLLRLALRNAARNAGRSTLTIGLVASASFLIVAVSAFRLDPGAKIPALKSGDGGFALVAESDQPIYDKLDVSPGRAIALRVKPGDDASCLNLYQPRQPRLLGIPAELIHRGGFARENPWLRLEDDLGTDPDGTPRVPVVIDKNTANYSLHLWKGVGETYDLKDPRGQTIVRLEVVRLLAGSIFQGDLLVSEAALLRHFPEVSGYRYFLIETPPENADAVRTALERSWGDYGLATETTAGRLAGLLAVQNTYLSTFQSLGGLGLLLGTFGLATVQLRNVLERRSELALLRAAGFRRSTLAWLVMLENGLLLLAGLCCGATAALVALLPPLIARSPTLPWASLVDTSAWVLGTLLLVLAVGLLAGLTAVRAALKAPLLGALREEH